jgi:molybdopterin synthase sulfur carrier subunit
MARVLMFGHLQDLAGWREREVVATTLSDLKTGLLAENAGLGQRLLEADVLVVVNHTVVRGDHPLTDADEVAFAPPVSGG